MNVQRRYSCMTSYNTDANALASSDQKYSILIFTEASCERNKSDIIYRDPFFVMILEKLRQCPVFSSRRHVFMEYFTIPSLSFASSGIRSWVINTFQEVFAGDTQWRKCSTLFVTTQMLRARHFGVGWFIMSWYWKRRAFGFQYQLWCLLCEPWSVIAS